MTMARSPTRPLVNKLIAPEQGAYPIIKAEPGAQVARLPGFRLFVFSRPSRHLYLRHTRRQERQ